MRIRILLQTSIVAAVVLVVALIAVTTAHRIKLSEVERTFDLTLEASRRVYSMLILTHEYALFAEERSARQWREQQAGLVEVLTAGTTERVAIPTSTLASAERLSGWFDALRETGSGNPDVQAQRTQMLVDRMLSGSQSVADAVHTWHMSVIAERNRIERSFRILALAAPGAALVFLVLLTVLLSRRVLHPLAKLHRAVAAVAQGDLTVRSATGTNDEFGELSRTFDSMALDMVNELRQEVAERTKAQTRLSASEARFRMLLERAPDAVFVQVDGKFSYVNSAACELFGARSVEDLLGSPVCDRLPSAARESTTHLPDQRESDASAAQPTEFCQRMDGSVVDVESSAVPLTYDGNPGVLVFLRDITERLQAEKSFRVMQNELHQAQKMETVGRLAGGVAHDYNNMLSVILGNAELGMMRVSPNDTLYGDFEQILEAGRRSREITKQLLSFARRQTLAPRLVDMNTAVGGMLKMLRQLLGENIDLVWRPREDLKPIRIDPSQLDQILANFCVNCRDAIGDTGKMTIETDMVSLDRKYCESHPGFLPGEFVMLGVSDDGCGMDRETRERVFEPFYTTKKMGQGTGLGLASIYGVVKQSGGFINVYSEPGVGTTFKIYMPCVEGASVSAISAEPMPEVRGRGETVLLVEDEPLLLNLAERFLTELGYSVIATNSPVEALQLAADHRGEIHLLVTDVVMPDLTGRDLANRLREDRGELKCLYMSGYTANVIVHRGVLDEGVDFIQKPFSRLDLASKVAAAMSTGM